MSDLQRPRGLNVEESTDSFGRFSAHPFERGYGLTIGNALRRVLISSIHGAAVTAVKFAGVQHELSTIPGVKEDTQDIILNLKRIPIRLRGEIPRTMRLKATRAGVVTSGDIDHDPHVEILDGDVHLATMTQPGRLEVEMRVKNARGFVIAEHNRDLDLEIGYIPIDSSHSPVRKVNYKVEPARIGQDTDYDRLVIDVTTDGSVKPAAAVSSASRLLREMLGIFGADSDESEETMVMNPEVAAFERWKDHSIDAIEDKLSVRAYNGLRNAEIGTIGQLATKTEEDLLGERNIGRKSIEEIEKVLKTMGLRLGIKES